MWITQGWYENQWWRKAESASCSSDIMESFIEQQRVVAISFYPSATGEDEEAYIHIVSSLSLSLSPYITIITPLGIYELLCTCNLLLSFIAIQVVWAR